MSIQNALLQMDLRASRLLLTSLVLVHVFAILAVLLADLHTLLRLGTIAGLLLGCYCSCRRQHDISYLQMGSGEIVLRRGDQMIPVTLDSAPWCNEWLQVLRFQPVEDVYSIAGRTGATQGRKTGINRCRHRIQKRRLNVVILPDSASAQSRRRLRVLLRWHRFAGGVPV